MRCRLVSSLENQGSSILLVNWNVFCGMCQFIVVCMARFKLFQLVESGPSKGLLRSPRPDAHKFKGPLYRRKSPGSLTDDSQTRKGHHLVSSESLKAEVGTSTAGLKKLATQYCVMFVRSSVIEVEMPLWRYPS